MMGRNQISLVHSLSQLEKRNWFVQTAAFYLEVERRDELVLKKEKLIGKKFQSVCMQTHSSINISERRKKVDQVGKE